MLHVLPKRASSGLGQITDLKKVYTDSYLTCFFPSWKTSSCIDWAVDWRRFDDKARLLRDFTASFPSVPLCRSASKQNWWVQVTRTWWLKRTAKMNDTFRTSGHKQAGWSSWERQGVYRAVSGKKKINTKNYPIAYSTEYSVLSFIRIPFKRPPKIRRFQKWLPINKNQTTWGSLPRTGPYFSKF